MVIGRTTTTTKYRCARLSNGLHNNTYMTVVKAQREVVNYAVRSSIACNRALNQRRGNLSLVVCAASQCLVGSVCLNNKGPRLARMFTLQCSHITWISECNPVGKWQVHTCNWTCEIGQVSLKERRILMFIVSGGRLVLLCAFLLATVMRSSPRHRSGLWIQTILPVS